LVCAVLALPACGEQEQGAALDQKAEYVQRMEAVCRGIAAKARSLGANPPNSRRAQVAAFVSLMEQLSQQLEDLGPAPANGRALVESYRHGVAQIVNVLNAARRSPPPPGSHRSKAIDARLTRLAEEVHEAGTRYGLTTCAEIRPS
jgi:hypothetical protein